MSPENDIFSKNVKKVPVYGLSAVFTARFFVNFVLLDGIAISENYRLPTLRTMRRLPCRIVNVARINILQTK